VAAYLLLGIFLLGCLVLLLRGYATADPKKLGRVLRWLGIGAIAALALFLALSGRSALAVGTAVALLPWLAQFRRARRTAHNFARAAAGGGSGGSSRVETRTLRMNLDHDSGDLDGEIVDGPFTGQQLSQLSRGQLLDLLRHCQARDPQSVQVLEAYLDRLHAGWREEAAGQAGTASGPDSKPGAAGGDGTMSRAEAYEILGLRPDASETEIRAAYHRLISALHPDRGGSNYLAAKLNRARQVLLDR
jgi:hypothetical protein